MYKKIFKRVFDILFSLILIIPFILIYIVVALLIKLEDGGPIFYNANRHGKNGKIFKMFKLRSMKINAPDIRNDDDTTYNGDNDPRVTKIGRFMRKTSIDELPQLFNVLKGDMSFVGPRANLPTKHYDNLSQIEKERIKVLPGITGFNQAYFRNSVTVEQKFKNDVYYVEHIGFIMDLKICIHTIFSVLKRENVYVNQPASVINTSADDTITVQRETVVK